MIPRLQARGTSFKGSCTYILHDQKAKTAERVDWVLSHNLHSDPQDAWFEMYQTSRDQDALKRNAGVSTRGRKNTAPVLHYTLAWHADDKPTSQEMKAAALASLKVLGLEEHEALIVAHSDKQHQHVHIVANTIHPYSGKTAALKYSKERLSEWAEEFERERGKIRCEERVVNNEKRREARELRSEEQVANRFAEVSKPKSPLAHPYIVIKDNSPNRPQWIAKQDVIERMKSLRAQVGLTQKAERDATWQRQSRERDALDSSTEAAIDHARLHTKERFRPQWRELYKTQGREIRLVAQTATHPFERAAFVFRNRERLGGSKKLTFRQMFGMIVSGKKLSKTLDATHQRERRSLAQIEKTQSKILTDRITAVHKARFNTLKLRQQDERKVEKGEHQVAVKQISYANAKTELLREVSGLERSPARPDYEKTQPAAEFNHAARQLPEMPQPHPIRADEIRRDMAAWRKHRPDHDLGREL